MSLAEHAQKLDDLLKAGSGLAAKVHTPTHTLNEHVAGGPMPAEKSKGEGSRGGVVIGHTSKGEPIYQGKSGPSITRTAWHKDSSFPGKYVTREGDHAPYGGENHHIHYHHADHTPENKHADYLGHVVHPHGEPHWTAVQNGGKIGQNKTHFGTRNEAENHLLEKHSASFKQPKGEKIAASMTEALDLAKGTMEETMHEFKEGSLHSGSKKGPKVKNRKQAIAIGLSQERKMGKGEEIYIDVEKGRVDNKLGKMTVFIDTLLKGGPGSGPNPGQDRRSMIRNAIVGATNKYQLKTKKNSEAVEAAHKLSFAYGTKERLEANKSELDNILDLLKAGPVQVEVIGGEETPAPRQRTGLIKAMGPGGIVFDFGAITGNPIADRLMLAMNENGEHTQMSILKYQKDTADQALIEYVEKGEAEFMAKNGIHAEEADPAKMEAVMKAKAEVNQTTIRIGREEIVAQSETDAAIVEMARAQGLDSFAAMEDQVASTIR